MTRTPPELEPYFQTLTHTTNSPNFRATPAGGDLVTTYDLACNKLHTRRIFSGIGSRGRDLTTRPPLPLLNYVRFFNAIVDSVTKRQQRKIKENRAKLEIERSKLTELEKQLEIEIMRKHLIENKNCLTRSCPNLETELQGTSGNCSDPLSIPDGAEEEKGSFHQQGISTIADKGLLASLDFRP
ncbi:hypothetical protein AVEN_47794-1 [Araneus ventricosus]|uniref:Uncharacterized protein n=1 Tax=Araneus ventricosus TaxID=182803 RepID=A0A4Y2LAX5_ARAVE|nr:hypothetical protein AVEN_47794-1 [Araneus ventricosus]